MPYEEIERAIAETVELALVHLADRAHAEFYEEMARLSGMSAAIVALGKGQRWYWHLLDGARAELWRIRRAWHARAKSGAEDYVLARNPMAPGTMAPRSLATTWEVWSYDVWGNAEDGYTVNNRSCEHRDYPLRLIRHWENIGTDREFDWAAPNDDQLRAALSITGDPDIEADAEIVTDGDDIHIYVEDTDGYPLGELHCISHVNLSPIGPATRTTE